MKKRLFSRDLEILRKKKRSNTMRALSEETMMIYQSHEAMLSAEAATESARAAKDAVKVARDTLNAGNSSFMQTLAEVQKLSAASQRNAEAAVMAARAKQEARKSQKPHL